MNPRRANVVAMAPHLVGVALIVVGVAAGLPHVVAGVMGGLGLFFIVANAVVVLRRSGVESRELYRRTGYDPYAGSGDHHAHHGHHGGVGHGGFHGGFGGHGGGGDHGGH